jgi:hypothetical protein
VFQTGAGKQLVQRAVCLMDRGKGVQLKIDILQAGYSNMEEGQGGGGGDEAKPESVPSFTEALNAFQTMKSFMYSHIITKIDEANIISTGSLLFNLKRTGATKQMKINDVLKKK